MKYLKVLILALILLMSPANGQTTGRTAAAARDGNFIGGNKIVGDTPEGYKDFLVLWVDYKAPNGIDVRLIDHYNRLLVPDKEGKIAVGGRVVFKGIAPEYVSYEYASAWLIERPGDPIRLIFDTEVIAGISYHFEGTFLENQGFSSGANVAHLEGVMVRRNNGRKAAENKLRFSPYNFVE